MTTAELLAFTQDMSEDVPLRRPGRPAQVSLERILEAGVAIGLPALSMTAVADALGVTPQALYRHVADREALEVLVGEHLIADFELPADVGQPWTDYLISLGHSIRQALLLRPGMGVYLQRLGSGSAGGLRIIEECDRVLVARGLRPVEALLAGSSVANLAIAAVDRQAAAAAPSLTAARDRFARAIEEVGAQSLPVLMAAVGEYRSLEPVAYFDWSLRALVAGMAELRAAGEPLGGVRRKDL